MTSDTVIPDDIFKCTRCGDCCRGYGGTFVTKAEIAAIAEYISLDPAEVTEKYCRISCKKKILGQQENGCCIFWDGSCSIHPVKPKMCRSWPFIESVLLDISNWQIMAGLCPGMRTDYPDPVIEECVRRELEK